MLDLVFINWEGQVDEVFMDKPFWTSNHGSIKFKIVMDRDRVGTIIFASSILVLPLCLTQNNRHSYTRDKPSDQKQYLMLNNIQPGAEAFQPARTSTVV